jgi:ribosomal-protein-alanine N-acetyltransferase
VYCTELPETWHELVRLRPIGADDLARWYGVLSQPQVYEHTSWNLSSADELTPYLWNPDAITDSSLLRFAIALRSSDELVGTIGFHMVSPTNRSAELAYDLDPSVWGRGIATSMCATLTAWGHSHAGLLRVQAVVLHTNLRSLRVLSRCAFVREGLLRSYRLVRGTPGDFWMHAHVVGIDEACALPASMPRQPVRAP